MSAPVVVAVTRMLPNWTGAAGELPLQAPSSDPMAAIVNERSDRCDMSVKIALDGARRNTRRIAM
jgi:hypothetical protein